MARTRAPVEMAAALCSGSAPLPSLRQPWARAAHLILGSGPSPFEATSQPSKGRPKTEDLRPNPLAGTDECRALLAWLDEGPPPIFVGFGSMVFDGDQATAIILAAAERADCRVLMQSGYSKLGGGGGRFGFGFGLGLG